MSQEPETPGTVFAAALQQWRDALRAPPQPESVRAGAPSAAPDPALAAPDSGHDRG